MYRMHGCANKCRARRRYGSASSRQLQAKHKRASRARPRGLETGPPPPWPEPYGPAGSSQLVARRLALTKARSLRTGRGFRSLIDVSDVVRDEGWRC